MSTTSARGAWRHELSYRPAIDYFRLLRHLPMPVLLASAAQGNEDDRYDILSAAPEVVVRTSGGSTHIIAGSGSQQAYPGDDPISALQSVMSPHLGVDTAHPDLPFSGGAIGWMSYELLHPSFRLPPQRPAGTIAMPDMLMGVFHWALVLDHQEQRATLACQPGCPEGLREQLLSLLQGPAPDHAAEDFRLLAPFQPDIDRQQYLKAFEHIINYIHAGDCYQVNLAQRFSTRYEGDLSQAFATLHARAKAPFSAFIESPEGGVMSFSPERFLKIRQGTVITQPIKGTRPRHDDALTDLKLRETLRESLKDQAENLMIVDLLRNDLGRVCDTGSVEVLSLFDIVSFTNVHHMVSTIQGRIEGPDGMFRLLRASFPGGSITGAPKQRAMEIIQELEPYSRSIYCGSIAYLGFDGNMDSSICIRTLVAHKGKIHGWGGGGIVADSSGDQEYQETLDKISMFLNGLL